MLRTLCVLACFLGLMQTASAQLHADFSASPAAGCAPMFVHFTDKSTGGATSWKWDLGNGTVSFLQNPSTTYFTPGKYSIKLVIKNAGSADSLVKTSLVVVNALPKPAFTASDTTGCYPLTVHFTDQSNAQEGNIVKWEWDLGDGAVSALPNPVHVYSGPGNYNVILRVTNSAGCTQTLSKAQYIKLKDGVKADFSYTGSNQCAPPSTIHFTNKSNGTGTLSYLWLFGDGNSSVQTNPANTYMSAGLYTLQLVVRNDAGCIDTLTKKDSIAVGIMHAGFLAPDSVCQNTSVQFTNTSQPVSGNSLWDMGNGVTATGNAPATIYPNAGTYQVTLITDFGSCKDSVSKTIRVMPKTKAAFTASQKTSCHAPFTVQFNNQTTGATSYLWLFGDSSSSILASPSHTYTKNGSYTVTLITTNKEGCSDTLQQPHFIDVIPANIQISQLPFTGCAPLLFTPNYAVLSPVPVTGFVWDFGDGGSSTAAHPSHLYNTPGVYTVKLTYTTADGCTDTIVYPAAVRAGQKPVANFNAFPTNTCASVPVLFSDNSTGNITGWFWQFGDGLSDTARNPLHQYNDTGYFSITLIVNNNGCSDTILKPNLVYIKPPIAKFSADVQCSDPFRYVFTNYSIGADSWNWDFGDGQSGTDKDPVHVYGQPGMYTVKLTVTNGSCTHTAAFMARVIKEKPAFAASDTVICKGDSITVRSFGYNPSNIMTWRWTPWNGDDTSRSVRIGYPASGQYTISLVTTNLNGCSDTLTRTNYITVNGPTANFSGANTSACMKDGASIHFADSSATDGTHLIKRWRWDFGDGNNQSYSAAPFVHQYAKPGFYTIALTVTDSYGCSDSIAKSNQVYIADPKAFFSSSDTMSCTNKPVSFTNLSQGQGLSFDWKFGDGNASPDFNPVHQFATVGTYDAWLRITDAYGCSDTISKAAYIHIEDPSARFMMSDSFSTCPPLVVHFTNQSKYYQLLSWDFGDGTNALVDTPTHYYNYPGTYYARLIVTSPGGCTDTIQKKIVIKGPTGSFDYNKTVSCNPGTVGFIAQTQNTVKYIWDFNDGGTIDGTDSVVQHQYNSLGIYVPRMILEDNKGCKVPIQGKDTIRIFGVSAMFGKSTRVLCDQGVINFTDSSLSNDLITDYRWDLGDGASSTDPSPVHTYTQPGQYSVKLRVTTANGCTDSSAVLAAVKVVSSPSIAIRGDSAACVPAQLQFTGQLLKPDTSALHWDWQLPNNQHYAQQNPPVQDFTQDGAFEAVLTVSNSSGCASVQRQPVLIHPLPVVNAGNNSSICEKKTIVLQATGADKYTWSPAADLSCLNCASPVASPQNTFTYHVKGESIFGCKASDSVIITVKHPFKLKVGSGDTLCYGESFRLAADNAEMYHWTPSAGLDNDQVKAPLAKPTQTTVYQVVGSDVVGCFTDTAHVNVVVYPIPTVDAGADKTLAVGSGVQIDAKVSADATTLRWQPSAGLSCANCPNPVASPKQTTVYQLTAVNAGGCANRDQLTVFVVCNNGNIFLPNTFSPNGNGTNDVFYPRGTGLYNIRSMRIFNRWGEPVYEATNFRANDASRGWNGNFKGKPAPNDVYVYYVEVVCENNALLTYSGNITLIR